MIHEIFWQFYITCIGVSQDKRLHISIHTLMITTQNHTLTRNNNEIAN